MIYSYDSVVRAVEQLRDRLQDLDDKKQILRAPELKALFDEIKTIDPKERAAFGKEVNQLRAEVLSWIEHAEQEAQTVTSIDVTAPFDANTAYDKRPRLLGSDVGSIHPLMREVAVFQDIFERMGFAIETSREIDDDYHMFGSLNFPDGHPARGDYDTFMTVEKASDGKPYVAPAHTSTMQNRMLKKYRSQLEKGDAIAVLVPDRVFRNEDLDARHEHTFYQFEGIYVSQDAHVGMLLSTLQTFFEEYYQKKMNLRVQPFYFPFTEPSFELVADCVFCDTKGCKICSHTGAIELGGCGMIHPNVLKMANIDPEIYTGFAWGFGVERPVMLKYGIEDIRHFESGKLEFLRQFS